MILYQENEIIIRTLEQRDKEEILEMFRNETFGLIGPLADERPSIVDEIKVIDKVLAKEEVSENYIILEQEGIIISYASIYQDMKDRIHIGTLITKKEYRNNGYATKLLRFIKNYANQNNLIVKAETLTCRSLLSYVGFANGERYVDYIYRPKQLTKEIPKIPVFLDYEGQQLINEQEEIKNLEDYKKTLQLLKSIGF